MFMTSLCRLTAVEAAVRWNEKLFQEVSDPADGIIWPVWAGLKGSVVFSLVAQSRCQGRYKERPLNMATPCI